MIEIKKINNLDEYNEFINEDKAIVKFSAEWCGPCKVLGNVISKLDNEQLNGYLFGEVNVDDDFAENITSNLNIRNIPVCVYFNNGKEVNRTVGIVKDTDIYTNVNS